MASCVTEKFITEFKIPFVRHNGEYVIEFIGCSYVDGGKAEIFIEIEKIRRGYLVDHLESCGIGNVIIYSFPSNDPSQLAAKFLHRVLVKTSFPEVKSYQRGRSAVVPIKDQNEDDNFIIYKELKSLQSIQWNEV